MQMLVRLILSAALIYWAVYGDSKIAMATLLVLMTAAHELAQWEARR